MKKIKSLFSLLLVMILMLSVAGPMAFADEADGSKSNPFVVTVKANNPYFYGDKYIGAGVSTDPAGLPLTEGTHFQVNVTDNGTSVTATPAAINAVDGLVYSADVDKYYKVNFVSATIDKPVLKLSAERMDFNASTKQYVGASPKVEGLNGAHTASDITYSVVDAGTSVTVTPASVVIKDASGNTVNSCYAIQYAPATFNKPTATFSMPEPQFNAEANKYVISGLDVGSIDAVKLTSEGAALVPTANFNMSDVVIEKNGDTVTAKLDKSKVYLSIGSVDVTAAYVITVNNGTHNRETIHIYPNTPVNGKANGYTVTKANGAEFTACDVFATIYIDNGVAKVDASSVQIMRSGYDLTNDYNVVLHTAGIDGNTGNNNTTTNPIGKTKLVIQAVDAEKAYNGYSFTATQARGVKYADGTSLQSGHTLNASALKIQYVRRSDGVGFNDYTDVYKVGTYDKKIVLPSTNVILDAAGNDVTSQYDITTINGVLTIYNAGWVSPSTGDESNVALWAILLGVSAVAAAAVVVVVLKKGKKA